MRDKFFIDTNILVYLLDQEDKRKKQIAKQILDQALNHNMGVISYQVVQEFLSVVTKKIAKPMNTQEARHWLKTILLPICKYFPSEDFYPEALNIKDNVGCSFYDALILQAAIEMECALIYSEDFQHGRVIKGMKIQNPFKE